MAHPIIQLFVPHPHNNHKAKILWPLSLFVLIGLYLMGYSGIRFLTQFNPGILGYASQINPLTIIELTNKERRAQNLPELKINQKLNLAAQAKATDMFSRNYWAHVSPTGVEPWYFITNSGYQYHHAGENLARDFANPADIVSAWMASPTHQRNLLDPRYQDIGIAVVDGYFNGVETTLVVQIFASPQTEVSQIAAGQVVNPVIASETKLYPSSGLSPLTASKVWSLAFILIIIGALLIDWLFVLRSKVIRLSGKSWAHLTFFITLTIILIIIRQGFVL